MVTVQFWGKTDAGLVREHNQDSFYVRLLDNGNQAACVVCDGMGGARSGNVASEIAVSVFADEVAKALRPGMNEKEIAIIVEAATMAANSAVYDKSMLQSEYSGMGTTLVGAIISGHSIAVSNIGDSRAYHINGDGIKRITADHSVVAEMLARGDLTDEEARTHPSKNLITRALGTEQSVVCDVFTSKINEGEFLLLCSDGLTNTVSEQEILFEVLHGGDQSGCCSRLIGLAGSRGAPDNITVILIER